MSYPLNWNVYDIWRSSNILDSRPGGRFDEEDRLLAKEVMKLLDRAEGTVKVVGVGGPTSVANFPQVDDGQQITKFGTGTRGGNPMHLARRLTMEVEQAMLQGQGPSIGEPSRGEPSRGGRHTSAFQGVR